MFGLVPVYSIDGITDVTKWNYVPHKGYVIKRKMFERDVLFEDLIERNLNANGYRLPTVAEWKYAARGGEGFEYAGSNNIDEVAWYNMNSSNKTHEVGKKKANGYGLYDMSGNVSEWCNNFHSRLCYGGSWDCSASVCVVDCEYFMRYRFENIYTGFRIVCSLE
jgi:formylglycine-generating enzyme required for sulfatase activity